MIRHLWIFLAPDDEGAFLGAIEAVDPGMIVVPSRYLRGDASTLLTQSGEGLEFPTLTGREHRRYLFHRKHSIAVRTFPVDEGPLAGASYIDETRTDCLMLVRPEPEQGQLEPSKLTGEIVRFSGGGKEKRSTSFITWVNRVMKALPNLYPTTSTDFIRVAPNATAFATSGGELTYLRQRIALK
jgi:hypothetical protein